MQKIAIIGTGNVGSTLARGWAAKGHEVKLSARDGNKAKELAKSIGATAGGIGEVVRAASIVVLAVPYASVPSVLAEAGSLKGKIVVDCTNPFTPDFMGLTVGYTDSAAENIARLAPGARVVKTLNHAFATTMAAPALSGQAATTFVASDDEEARKVIAGLVEELGFEAVGAGGLANARYLEPLAELLIQLGFGQGLGTGVAFKLIRR